MLFGFGRAFISLLRSKWMAKRPMGVRLIVDPTDANRNQALLAVSTGLLERLNRAEVEAVLGHEVSHIANGDMVTLTIIAGVVNTFVIFFARIIGWAIDRLVLRNEDERGAGYFIAVVVAELLLGVLASAIVMRFSRRREYPADAGGAQLAGLGSMMAALRALKRQQSETALNGDPALPSGLAAYGITGTLAAGLKLWFMSLPLLDDRIAALEASQINAMAPELRDNPSMPS